MIPPICVPYTFGSIKEIQASLDSVSTDVAFVEIYADHLTLDEAILIPTIHGPNTIITIRRAGFVETKHSLREKKDLLKSLSSKELFVDLDVLQEKEELEFFRQAGGLPSLVSSYHNYEKTPSLDELVSIYRTMIEVNPKVYKFSCYCSDDSDCITLLKILETLKRDRRTFVVSGMGEKGKAVRIAAALQGNAWNYVSLNDDLATAKGQFTIDEFKAALTLLC